MSNSGANKTVNADAIHLQSFHVFQCNINASGAFRDAPQTIPDIRMNASGDYVLDDKKKVVGIRIFVSIEGVDEEGASIGSDADFGIEFHYVVEGLSDCLQYQEEEILVSSNLLGTLLGIAYSTARGLIYDRLKGGFLEDTILPVINPLQLIREQEAGE